jgi:hypothetical protein
MSAGASGPVHTQTHEQQDVRNGKSARLALVRTRSASGATLMANWTCPERPLLRRVSASKRWEMQGYERAARGRR